MTSTHHTKVLQQIGKKPGKLAKYKKHSVPKDRKNGRNAKQCKLCGRTGAHIQKYGMDVCRHCFKDNATKLGFKKYS